MKIGDKVRVKPKPYGYKGQFIIHTPLSLELAMVIEIGKYDTCVEFDELFPEMSERKRKHHNRYWYPNDYLEVN